MSFASQDDRLRLSFVEAVLLWTLRADAGGTGMEEGSHYRAALGRALQRAGLAQAEPYLLGFLWALRHGAVRRPVLHAIGEACISVDERALLDTPGLVQSGRGIEAVMVLRGMMAPAAVRAALASLERLVALAEAAGQAPTAPERDTARFAMPTRTVHHSATLH